MTDYSQRKVLVLYTGGTIGMVGQPLKPGSLQGIKDNMPELGALPYEVTYKEFFPSGVPIDSVNANINLYNALASEIGNEYNHYEGIVIIFGTDTMAPSAGYLSYMLEGLKKPVVFTGSMKTFDEADFDGPRNLTDAIHFAARSGYDIPLVPEVTIMFHGKALRGASARKLNADSLDSFDSPGVEPLAEISETGHITVNTDVHIQGQNRDFRTNHIKDDVKILPLNMAFMEDAELEEFCSRHLPEQQALMVYGIDDIAQDSDKFNIIEKYRRKDQPIFYLGTKTPDTWIGSGSMTEFQQAMAKARYVLSLSSDVATVKNLYESNLRGEREGIVVSESDILETYSELREVDIARESRTKRF